MQKSYQLFGVDGLVQLILCVLEVVCIIDNVRVNVDMHAERTGHKLVHTRLRHVMFLGTAGILTGGHCIKVTLKGG